MSFNFAVSAVSAVSVVIKDVTEEDMSRKLIPHSEQDYACKLEPSNTVCTISYSGPYVTHKEFLAEHSAATTDRKSVV